MIFCGTTAFTSVRAILYAREGRAGPILLNYEKPSLGISKSNRLSFPKMPNGYTEFKNRIIKQVFLNSFARKRQYWREIWSVLFNRDREIVLIISLLLDRAVIYIKTKVYHHWIIRAFAKFGKATITFVMYVCPPACPTTWNNSAPTGRIFMKFDIWVFFENMSKKYKFH
jgi:hypothetical protein